MAEMTSPGVYTSEYDLSAIATNNSQTTTVFGGNFTKGPLEKYVQITNVDELIDFYGKPTNNNYNDWYQCYNFLQYSSNLLVSRACNINGNAVDTLASVVATTDLAGYGVQKYGTSPYGVGENTDGYYVMCDKKPEVQVGDIVSFGESNVDVLVDNYPKFTVLKVESVTYVKENIQDANGVSEQSGVEGTEDAETIVYKVTLDRTPTMLVDNEEAPVTNGTSMFKIEISLNGSGEALGYANASEIVIPWKKTKRATFNIPLRVANYLNDTQYYKPEKVTITEDHEDINTGEWYQTSYDIFEKNVPTETDASVLFKFNKQIKNDDHFVLIKDTSLSFATPEAKLKFFSKTPGTEDAKYRVCIALPEDFAVNDTRFVGNHCSRYVCEGISLDGLFEYAPKLGSAQIGVVVYDPVALEAKETYLVSLDPKEVDAYNNSMYIEDVINRKSNCVYVKDNLSLPAMVEVERNVLDVYGNKIKKLSSEEYRTQVDKLPNVCSYCFIYDTINNKYYGRSVALECSSDSGIQEDDLLDAYEIFDNKEDLSIDYVIGNELDNGLSAKNLAETRQDCVVFIGIPKEYNGENVVIGKKASDATSNIIKYRNSINYNSMWISLAANYKYQYDRYNDVYRWVNIAGDCAGIRAKCTTDIDSWWAAAGLDRGQVKNVTKLAYAPNQTQRGTLYTNSINPVVTFPGEGTVLWGQKTLLNKNSSFNRVNVRCLFNTIERTLAQMSRYQVFEFNDSFTRNKVLATIKPYLATVQAGRGIQDYKVVCDTTNNTAQIIAENKLIVDIYVKPTYVAEFIHLRFFNVGINDFTTSVVE